MRRSRIPATLGTAALVTVSSLVLAAPAQAATTVNNFTFYGESDFGQEASGYPAGVDWFFGDDSDGPGLGTATFGLEGLVINDGSGTNGVVQILNQNIETPETPEALMDLLSSISVFEGPSVTPGAWTFQLPLFAQGTNEFTTLRPVDAGETSPSGDWLSSQPIYEADNTTVAIAAGDPTPLADLLDAIYNTTDNDPTILAYGFWFGAASEVTLRGVEFDGQVSIFRANVPTRAIAPGAEVTTSETEDGLVFSGTGWFPGDEVYFDIFFCEDSEEGPSFDETYTVTRTGDESARADGTFEITVTFEPGLAPGEYCYYLDDDGLLYYGGSGVMPGLTLTVVPDELPETGADPANILLAASGLLAAGALALVAVTVRRRATV